VDHDPAIVELCRRNAEALGFTGRVHALCLSLPRGIDDLAGRAERFDLVFVDPPYASSRRNEANTPAGSVAEEVLRRLAASGILAPGARVVVEHDRRHPPDAVTPGMEQTDRRRFGDTEISLFRRED
jgi:16S rRNA G966 N2-methylase RsmD